MCHYFLTHIYDTLELIVLTSYFCLKQKRLIFWFFSFLSQFFQYWDKCNTSFTSIMVTFYTMDYILYQKAKQNKIPTIQPSNNLREDGELEFLSYFRAPPNSLDLQCSINRVSPSKKGILLYCCITLMETELSFSQDTGEQGRPRSIKKSTSIVG